jgi:hypothetical protein
MEAKGAISSRINTISPEILFTMDISLSIIYFDLIK